MADLDSLTTGCDAIEQCSVLAERIMAIKLVVARVVSIGGYLAEEFKVPCNRLSSVFFNPLATEIAACCCRLYERSIDILSVAEAQLVKGHLCETDRRFVPSR